MKIQDVGQKQPPFDVAVPLGEHLISTGQFRKYVDPFATAKPTHVLTFALLPSPDPFTEPAVAYSCSCGINGYTNSKKGTAHKAPIFHCGGPVLCDDATADAYVKAFKAFSRAKDEPQPAQPKKVFFANVGR
jgi:hypothetical protein